MFEKINHSIVHGDGEYRKVNLGKASRPIYVNVDSPNLGFPYFNFFGGTSKKKTPCIFASNHRKIDREKSTVTTKNPGTKRRQIRSHKIVRVTLALALAGKVCKLQICYSLHFLRTFIANKFRRNLRTFLPNLLGLTEDSANCFSF